jgi:uncharacterized protein YxeA
MNKYLPKELVNLKESKNRVIQNVEATVYQEHSISKRMKRGLFTLATVAVIAASAFFIYNEVATNTENHAAMLEVGIYDEQLKRFFSDDNTKKWFTDYSSEPERLVTTHWLSEQYVLESIHLNNSNTNTIKYYRIANNEIQLVAVTDDHVILTIEELNKLKAKEIVLRAPFQKNDATEHWKVIETDATFDGYTDIVILEKMEEGLRIQQYYVEQIGVVKEEYYKKNELIELMHSSYMRSYNTQGRDKEMSFMKVENAKVEPTFHTPWLSSPNGSLQVTLEGLGEQGAEEGIGKLIVKDTKTNDYTLYLLNTEQDVQATAKDFVWIDENRLFITIGYPYGHVAVGGALYELNLQTGDLTPIISELTKYEGISEIKRLSNERYAYRKFVYDNDEMDSNQSHVEEGLIDILRVTVQKVEDGLIYYSKAGENKTLNTTLSEMYKHEKGIPEFDQGKTYEFILVDNQVVQVGS